MGGWPNLNDLLTQDERAPVGLVGAPLAAGSVTPGKCDQAPGKLRATLTRMGRYDVETRHEIASRIRDYGDVAIDGLSIEEATAPIREAVAASVKAHPLTLLIGGNNAVTRPGVHGLGLPLERVGLITLDAHFDMRDLDRGLGNGNPVRALIEDGMPGGNIAQIGLAPFANSKAMHDDAERGGHLILTVSDVREKGAQWCADQALARVKHVEAVLVDCDIDVIDRSQFPAAPGARPDGLQVREFFELTRRLAAEPKVRVIDLTEWDPPLDPSDLSALTAARWLAEALAGFEAR
jgi:arginase family enzyme